MSNMKFKGCAANSNARVEQLSESLQDIINDRNLLASEKKYLMSLPPRRRVRLMGAIRKTVCRFIRDAPIRFRVVTSSLPDSVKGEIFKSIGLEESEKMKTFVESALTLPFGKYIDPPLGIDTCERLRVAQNVMDEHIVGHRNVKECTLAMYNQWLHGGNAAYAIGLEGPPGVGKTTFVKEALARVFDRPMAFINLGGATDATYLTGHGYTYEGARYGRLAAALIETSIMNPILYFDELDKVSETSRGQDIANTLIHLTDPVQNHHIRDRYFHGIDLDFSKCVLVFSYNDPSRISPILLDRLQRMEMRAPTIEEKRHVVKTQMLPRSLRRIGTISVDVQDDAIEAILDAHRNDVGMRGVEKSLDRVVSCAATCVGLGSCKVVGLGDRPLASADRSFVKHVLRDVVSKDSTPSHMYI